MTEPTFLILEDEEPQREGLKDLAVRAGYSEGSILLASDVEEAEKLLKKHGGADVWIVDLLIGGEKWGGYRFCQANFGKLWKRRPWRVYFRSGRWTDDEEQAIKAVGREAFVFLKKGRDEDNSVDETLQREIAELHGHIKRSITGKYVVESEEDRQFDEKLLPIVATSGLPVLILGPSGSGKERAARRIAEMSGRDQSLVRTINCACYTDELLVSEIFGHCKGTFTGANRSRLGLVLEASGYPGGDTNDSDFASWACGGSKGILHDSDSNSEESYTCPCSKGGVLILDEVAELSPRAQAMLLRMLDNYPIKPLGYDGVGFQTNVLVIGLANNAKKLNTVDQFREDLLFRLKGWCLNLPGINEPQRRDTATGIVKKYLSDHKKREGAETTKYPMEIHDATMRMLMDETVPNLSGGIRELQWLIGRAAAFANQAGRKNVTTEDLCEALKFGEIPIGDQDLQLPTPAGPLTQDIDDIKAEIVAIFARHDSTSPTAQQIFSDFINAMKNLTPAGIKELANLRTRYTKGRMKSDLAKKEAFLAAVGITTADGPYPKRLSTFNQRLARARKTRRNPKI